MENEKNILRILILIYLFLGGFLFAEEVPAPPSVMGRPGGSGGDTGTPGAQSIPVDMYVYVLAVAAIMLIAFFARKYKTQK